MTNQLKRAALCLMAIFAFTHPTTKEARFMFNPDTTWQVEGSYRCRALGRNSADGGIDNSKDFQLYNPFPGS